MSSARGPWRRRAAATASKTLARALGRRAHLVGVQPDVELGEVEAEQLDPPLERGEPPGRDARAAVRLEAAADHAEVGEQLRRASVPSLVEPRTT